MFIGQTYVVQSVYDAAAKKVINDEVSTSTLHSYFENPDYEFSKSTEMVTTISEDILDGIGLYIKKVPNTDRRILNIFGSGEKIRDLIDRIMNINARTLLNTVNDTALSEQNFSDRNLKFSNKTCTIAEEVEIFELTKSGTVGKSVQFKKEGPYGA